MRRSFDRNNSFVNRQVQRVRVKQTVSVVTREHGKEI
jgi:hypothetical protein